MPKTLLSLTDEPGPGFPVVTPRAATGSASEFPEEFGRTARYGLLNPAV